MFGQSFAPPRFRPALNVGCLMDITTGYYELGEQGESILNGGVSGITGIAARPNNFKTALAIYMEAMLRRNCRKAVIINYDSEGTLHPVKRFTAVGRQDPYLSTLNYEDDPQFIHTDLSQYTGDEFFDLLRKELNTKGADEKTYQLTTPFLDKNGKPRQALYPSGVLIDSLSRMTVKAVEDIYAKNSIGESGMNTEAMNNGRAKKQMFNQLPQLCAKTGSYMFLTAHVKDVINMEMYPTDKRNLSYMKKDTALEGVSGGFYSLPNNVWMVTANKPLVSKDKTPEYPLDNSKAMANDTDLSLITMINLRGKSGLSGFPIDLIFSQSEGLLASLTEFHFCKDRNRYGIGGSLQNYYMELLPDVTLSRTKVRQKLNQDIKLRRAVSFTAEMLQIEMFLRDTDPNLLCDPKTLREDLIAKGYDWDRLLDTRGYWVFKEEEKEHEQPFLSTMDLLRMRAGLYHPKWYGPLKIKGETEKPKEKADT